MPTKQESVQRKGSGALQINVKLNADANQQQAVKVLSAIPAVRDVIRLFPDESDQELSQLYVIEIDPSGLKSALEAIRHNPDVEYAEDPSPRKLIR